MLHLSLRLTACISRRDRTIVFTNIHLKKDIGVDLYLKRMTLPECAISLMIFIITVHSVTSSVRDDKWLLSHVFQHQDLPLCSQVALIPGYLTPCHVRSAEDEAALPCLVNRNCGHYQGSHMKIPCSDGSFNKTCMPQYVSPDPMLCACSRAYT